jgi:hypothetical protein
MKHDWEPDVKQAVTKLWNIAVERLGEDRARELFVTVTKRGRGKRGAGRNLAAPSKAAARMRRSYIPKDGQGLTIQVERELTEKDWEDFVRHEQEDIDWLRGTKKK